MARPPARWAVASILLLLELLGTVASTQAKDDISSEQARHPGGNSTGNSTQHTRSLVWPQPYADLPWLAHPSVKLDWEGVTDFEKLARVRIAPQKGCSMARQSTARTHSPQRIKDTRTLAG